MFSKSILRRISDKIIGVFVGQIRSHELYSTVTVTPKVASRNVNPHGPGRVSRMADERYQLIKRPLVILLCGTKACYVQCMFAEWWVKSQKGSVAPYTLKQITFFKNFGSLPSWPIRPCSKSGKFQIYVFIFS